MKATSLPSAAASEAGPSQTIKNDTAKENEIEQDDEESEKEGDDEVMQDAEGSDSESESAEEEATTARSRKRKRAAAEDLEESYMRRVAKEERKQEQRRQSEKSKRQKVDGRKDDSDTPSDEPAESKGSDASSDGSDESEGNEAADKENETPSAPMHESQSGEKQANEVEKSRRTVFLGNVSTEAIKSKSAKKMLLKHLGSFLSTLPESTGPHKVESIRFRSTPFASGGHIPKRASYARKEILDDTTLSTNAYAVYTTAQGARNAATTLNGTVVLGRHLRVDNVAHPAPIDHRRCVFVGNLDFVDQDRSAENEQGKKKKNTNPADIEEGLWRTFNAPAEGSSSAHSSKVESVRVIRDRATRVGKGFAYVQFYDQNGVEEALLLDGKKFPPMLPRKLRVVRAKKTAKKNPESSQGPHKGGPLRGSDKSLLGRAGKLLGKAGAAKLKTGGNGANLQGSVVFEGHRATANGSRIKMRSKSRGLKGKPKTRSSKRAATYRATGGRKEKSKT